MIKTHEITYENGHPLCPYCFKPMSLVVQTWKDPPVVSHMICHWCNIKFKV